MSAAAQVIDEAVDRVHLAALNKLAARLEEETDPIRIERLLAIALRAKRPDGQRHRKPTSPAPAGEVLVPPAPTRAGRSGAERNGAGSQIAALKEQRPAPEALRGGEGKTVEGTKDARSSASSPTTTPTHLQPRTNASRQTSTNDEDELSFADLAEGPADPLPLAHPMTDDEFHALFKEVGLTEAHRQRIIRATLVNEQRKRANSS